MTNFNIKKGDLAPSLEYTFSGISSLTGATVVFRMRHPTQRNVYIIPAGTVVIVDAVLRKVRYDWQVGDTNVVGTCPAEFIVTPPTNKPLTFPNDGYLTINITDRL